MDQQEEKKEERMKVIREKIVILYGSQTGNAEDMAKRIGYMAKILFSNNVRKNNVIVQAMDDYPLAKLTKENFVIFVCSTTGFGQEPENMKNFYNFIRRRDLPNACLTNLNFVVYGLGDSSYVKFNFVSKILYKRLIECGAKPLQELVTGNEQATFGCDSAIYPKLQELWYKLDPSYEKINTLNQTSEINSLKLKESSYEVNFIASNCCETSNNIFKESYRIKYNIKTASCILNKRITSEDHFQDTRHLCFKCDFNIDYKPGDVCTILPENSDENINKFIELLNLDPNQRVRLIKKDNNYMIDYLYDFIPDGIKVYDIVRCYLDILSVPKRSFFEYLWQFSDDELEKGKLQEFATTVGQEEMSEYCLQPKRSILEVLIDFPHSVKNINFKYLFDLIPPIKSRSFSIASSNKLHPNEIHLIVGVVKYQTRLRKIRQGLCSTYLSKLEPVDLIKKKNESTSSTANKSDINFFIKKTSFILPDNLSTPIIMIGPGLGIAPFRSFIEELSMNSIQIEGPVYLYFGCRYQNADFYFKQELEDYSSKGLIKLRCAFSRENPKQYVQDLISKDSEILADLVLNKGGVIYVAGNSKLPESIRDFVKKLIQNSGDADIDSKVAAYVTKLESQNRLQYDCW